MAADVAFLVSSYLDDNKITNLCVSTLLESIDERQSLQGAGCSKEWIAKLNSLLNSKSDRWLGITLLGTTLKQCDTEVFTSNCTSWIKVLQQILESPASSTSLIQSSIKLLDDFLKYTTQFPDLMRNVANSTIPAIVTALLSLHEQDSKSALMGLCICLKYFPGPSSQFRIQIEQLLISSLDTNNEETRQHCTKCYALVSSLSNTSQHDKQRKNWDVQWRRIISTIHNILNTLHSYDGIPSDVIANDEILPVKSIESDEPKRTNTSTCRLRTLLKCLEAMVREGTRKVVVVPLSDTITLIERILSVNEGMLRGNVSLDVVLLKTCLPLIHLDAISLLCSLTKRCGSLLMPYANRIAKMLVKELSWTSNELSSTKHDGFTRPYRNLRCAVYDCFCYLAHLNASFNDNIIKDVMCHIVKEIQISKSSQTQLKAQSTNSTQQKSSSKKGKKRKLQEMEQLCTNYEKLDPLCNVKICLAALNAFSSTIMNFSDCMKTETFQEIQLSLFEVVSQIQSGSLYLSPYVSPECRKQVYHCLLACVLARPSRAPIAISCAIKYFKEGLQDPNFKVSSYCREALTVTSSLIHPMVPSIEIASSSLVHTSKVSQKTDNSSVNSTEGSPIISANAMDIIESQRIKEAVDLNHNQNKDERRVLLQSKTPQSVLHVEPIDEQNPKTIRPENASILKPDSHHTIELTHGTTTGPNYGTTTLPNHSPATTPNHGTTAAPNHGTTTAPNHGTITAPNHGTSTGPNHGTTTGSNHSTTSGPNHGTTTTPNHGTITAPNHGTTTGPNYSTTTAPNHGKTTRPNHCTTSESNSNRTVHTMETGKILEDATNRIESLYEAGPSGLKPFDDTCSSQIERDKNPDITESDATSKHGESESDETDVNEMIASFVNSSPDSDNEL